MDFLHPAAGRDRAADDGDELRHARTAPPPLGSRPGAAGARPGGAPGGRCNGVFGGEPWPAHCAEKPKPFFKRDLAF